MRTRNVVQTQYRMRNRAIERHASLGRVSNSKRNFYSISDFKPTRSTALAEWHDLRCKLALVILLLMRQVRGSRTAPLIGHPLEFTFRKLDKQARSSQTANQSHII